MNADFLAVLEFWEREKGINRDVLVAAVEEALLSAAKKAVGPARELRVVIDQKNGDIKAFAKLIVSDKAISKHDQISVFDARRIKPDAQVGDEVEVEVTPVGFGRIAAQYAKQALMQHIRRAEKQLIFAEFKDRLGDIISGTVRRFERSDVIIDLVKYEALLPRSAIRTSNPRACAAFARSGTSSSPATRSGGTPSRRRRTSVHAPSSQPTSSKRAPPKASTAPRSFFPGLILALLSSFSSSKSPRSTMGPSKSKESRVNLDSAPSWRSGRVMRKWIPSALALDCVGNESRISCAS